VVCAIGVNQNPTHLLATDEERDCTFDEDCVNRAQRFEIGGSGIRWGRFMEGDGGGERYTELGCDCFAQLIDSAAAGNIDRNSIGVGGFAVEVEYDCWHRSDNVRMSTIAST
jgi:hypothetical protein